MKIIFFLLLTVSMFVSSAFAQSGKRSRTERSPEAIEAMLSMMETQKRLEGATERFKEIEFKCSVFEAMARSQKEALLEAQAGVKSFDKDCQGSDCISLAKQKENAEGAMGSFHRPSVVLATTPKSLCHWKKHFSTAAQFCQTFVKEDLDVLEYQFFKTLNPTEEKECRALVMDEAGLETNELKKKRREVVVRKLSEDPPCFKEMIGPDFKGRPFADRMNEYRSSVFYFKHVTEELKRLDAPSSAECKVHTDAELLRAFKQRLGYSLNCIVEVYSSCEVLKADARAKVNSQFEQLKTTSAINQNLIDKEPQVNESRSIFRRIVNPTAPSREKAVSPSQRASY